MTCDSIRLNIIMYITKTTVLQKTQLKLNSKSASRSEINARSQLDNNGEFVCSEALSMHDARSHLVVLVLGDPHLREAAERAQDRATDPHRVLPLRRRNALDLHTGRRQ